MASATLYPPIVSSSQPAFVASSNELRVYFSLSALSSQQNISALNAQVLILRKDGVKVINTSNSYAKTGVIINKQIVADSSKKNQYYITINGNELKTEGGFTPGWIYKVQIRLSEVTQNGSDKQADWITQNSNKFSEWSNICYIKAISGMIVKIPVFDFSSDKIEMALLEEEKVINLKSMNFFGSIQSVSPSDNECFDYCQVEVYDRMTDKLVDASGNIYKTEVSNTAFKYDFRAKFEDQGQKEYELIFNYVTENGYTPREPFHFIFTINEDLIDSIDAHILTAETDIEGAFEDLHPDPSHALHDHASENYSPSKIDGTDLFHSEGPLFPEAPSPAYTKPLALDTEEDEGRIGLKIYSPSHDNYSGNVCIRRSSEQDRFSIQEDIKIIPVKMQDLNDLPVVYDYTIESGVLYKYTIQPISTDGERGEQTEPNKNPVQRVFNYSYLLGKDNRQLKLQFDNTMGSFKHQLVESKMETLGSKYPFITKNANVNYKTFPINGLISFNMDENSTFLTKEDYYNYKNNDVKQGHEDYNKNNNITMYDYTQERDFRKEVLNFLMDGEPKLFKSPTEGNIIVRLMDVNCTPNQSLGRLVYSFTANAFEIDEYNYSNCLKYGFLYPGTQTSDLSVTETHLGQIDGELNIVNGRLTENIIDLIVAKYGDTDKDYGGYTKRIESISRLKITFSDPPYAIEVKNKENNSTTLKVGRKIVLNDTDIILDEHQQIYEFDSLIKFEPNKSNAALYLEGDCIAKDPRPLNVTIDFLYDIVIEPYKGKEIAYRASARNIGQYYQNTKPGTSIYTMIQNKYYIETKSIFRYLKEIKSIKIEANPHTVFLIQDGEDREPEQHEVNETGVLSLQNLSSIKEIIYVGKRYLTDGYNKSSVSNDIITTKDVNLIDINGNPYILSKYADINLTYSYVLVNGEYVTEG